MTDRTVLDLADLHASLADPSIEAMNFLNEIMERYPDAISFAPGAPYEPFLEAVDVPHYLAVWTEHLRRGGYDETAVRRSLLQYGPSRGVIADLVAEMLRRDEGLDLAPSSIVVTVGAQEALLLAVRVLCASRVDGIAVVEPAYVGMRGAARLLDVPIAPVACGHGGVDLDSLATAVAAASRAGRRIRALYVAPDHANPSGIQLDLDDRYRLLDAAGRYDLVLLEDTAYRFTAARAGRPPTLKALDTAGRVVQVGTFAKICAPGARVGYLVADQPVRSAGGTRPLAALLATAKSMVTLNTSPIAQAVIGGMLVAHGGSLAALAEQRAAHYRANLRCLRESLRRAVPDGRYGGVRWEVPDGGFFGRMTLPVPADLDLLMRCAQRYGVLWTPMRDFYQGSAGDHSLRLSCSYLTTPLIEEGVARLARFVADLTAPGTTVQYGQADPRDAGPAGRVSPRA